MSLDVTSCLDCLCHSFAVPLPVTLLDASASGRWNTSEEQQQDWPGDASGRDEAIEEMRWMRDTILWLKIESKFDLTAVWMRPTSSLPSSPSATPVSTDPGDSSEPFGGPDPSSPPYRMFDMKEEFLR